METQSGLVANVASKRDYRKRRLLTAGHLDGRTRGTKRARQIAAELTADFGPEITETQKQAAERAAMLCALAEDLAARRLAGEAVSLDELMIFTLKPKVVEGDKVVNRPEGVSAPIDVYLQMRGRRASRLIQSDCRV
jgi:hypothetical protein